MQKKGQLNTYLVHSRTRSRLLRLARGDIRSKEYLIDTCRVRVPCIGFRSEKGRVWKIVGSQGSKL
jgi:hypothetical protein